MENNELYHYGVKGMKWGVRKEYVRSAGRNFKKKANKLYADIKKKVKARREAEKLRKYEEEIMKKPVKKLNATELKDRYRILEERHKVLDMEKKIKDLNNDTMSAGKAFLNKFAKEAIGGAIITAGKNVLSKQLTKMGNDAVAKAMEENKKKEKKKKDKENKKKEKEKDKDKDKDKDKNSDNNDPDNSNSNSTTDNDPPKPPGGGGSDSSNSSRNSNSSSNQSRNDYSDEPLTGDVIGEGTSRRQQSTRDRKSYDYDVDLSETGLATVRENTSLVSTGSQYIQYLLEDKSR